MRQSFRRANERTRKAAVETKATSHTLTNITMAGGSRLGSKGMSNRRSELQRELLTLTAVDGQPEEDERTPALQFQPRRLRRFRSPARTRRNSKSVCLPASHTAANARKKTSWTRAAQLMR